MRPVEEVADDHGQRQPAPPVLARDLQQLLLGAVAQLALPETGGPLGKFGRVAGRVRVAAQHVGGLTGGDPVVDLAGAVGDPAGAGLGQLHPADRRRVPQQAVAAVGDQQRDGDLGVALHQVDHGALLVQQAVGVLAEAVEPLAGIGAEPLLEPVVAVARRGGEARSGPPEVGGLLGEQLGAVLGADERQRAGRRAELRGEAAFGVRVDPDGQPAVDEGRVVLGDLDLHVAAVRPGVEQRPRQVVEQRPAGSGPDPDGVTGPTPRRGGSRLWHAIRVRRRGLGSAWACAAPRGCRWCGQRRSVCFGVGRVPCCRERSAWE